MTRSCTARAPCLPRCPATTGRNSPTCAPITPSCGAIRARSCCSWAASSRHPAEWNHDAAARLGAVEAGGVTRRACSAGARPQHALPRHAGAARRDCEARGLRVDRRRTTPNARLSPGCAAAGRATRRWSLCNFTPVERPAGRWACPRRPLARGAEHRRGALRRAGPGQPGRTPSRRPATPWHGQPAVGRGGAAAAVGGLLRLTAGLGRVNRPGGREERHDRTPQRLCPIARWPSCWPAGAGRG